MPALNVCAVRGCVAEPVPGCSLCAPHMAYTKREPETAPIYCYACGKLIEIGYRWVVRQEGAFHARRACLSQPAQEYKIPARSLEPCHSEPC